ASLDGSSAWATRRSSRVGERSYDCHDTTISDGRLHRAPAGHAWQSHLRGIMLAESSRARPRSHRVRLAVSSPSIDSHREEELALDWHATTILSVRKGDRVAIGGDGQVTLGTQVMKADAVKIRKLMDGQVLVGFAG